MAAEVIDGPQSRVLDEAENRRHVQKALLATGALIMRGLQWHYDRLVDEFRAIARVTVTDLRSGGAPPAPWALGARGPPSDTAPRAGDRGRPAGRLVMRLAAADARTAQPIRR